MNPHRFLQPLSDVLKRIAGIVPAFHREQFPVDRRTRS
jgi:hypothetical protein